MNVLGLRFPGRPRDDLPLGQGVHSIGRDADGSLGWVGRGDALLQVCIDRRGAWLQASERASGLHLNGRPVRRMAMLRPGDSIHLDGTRMVLLGAAPRPMPTAPAMLRDSDRRAVLRAIGGPCHGRSFGLDESREVGRDPECDIRLDDPDIAGRHVRLEPHQDGIVMRDLGATGEVVVNGHAMREGLLKPGDQVVFGNQYRFVLEAPLSPDGLPAMGAFDEHDEPANDAAPRSPVASSMRRLPWLLLAALGLAAALTLLLVFGPR